MLCSGRVCRLPKGLIFLSILCIGLLAYSMVIRPHVPVQIHDRWLPGFMAESIPNRPTIKSSHQFPIETEQIVTILPRQNLTKEGSIPLHSLSKKAQPTRSQAPLKPSGNKTHPARAGQDMSPPRPRRRELLEKLPRVTEVTCGQLWAGNQSEIDRALLQMSQWKVKPEQTTLQEYQEATQDCGRFRRDGGFQIASVSEEEKAFPLAFSLVVYKDADQVERLLRAIYRPHNAYCIHVDKKSSEEFRSKLEKVSSCLPNVLLANVSVDVQWSRFTNLEPEVICMRQLWDQKVNWRYFINLTGQEFPLKTNKELVRILQAYKGANDIEGDSTVFHGRWEKFLPAPYNLTIYKGWVHITASRGYVGYALFSNVGRALLKWVKPTAHPDESYFNTLNHNHQLGVPGSANFKHDKNYYKSFNRYMISIWTSQRDKKYCKGTFVRQICHFGVGDLQRLTSSTQLFTNKFTYEFQPLGYDCLEEWYFKNIWLEENGRPRILDLTPYQESKLVSCRYTGKVKVW